MRGLNRIFPVGIFVAAALSQACGNPQIDDTRQDRRVFPPAGVIRGTVTYQGPHPCSQNGHIVGGALVLVFNANNPPPPAQGGLATTAVNFAVVTGDELFANEPRNPNADKYCPKDHGHTDNVLATAPFTVAPMDAGQYVIQSFYDYTGNFFPLFSVRRLAEAGDTLGGFFDIAAAASHQGDANYLPHFLPITIGVPDQNNALQIPLNGYLADNIAVQLASTTPFPRPYFYPANPADPANDPNGSNPSSNPQLGGYDLPNLTNKDLVDFPDSADKLGTKPHPGSQEMDPNWMPVVTMTQDHMVYAQPKTRIQTNVDAFQASFKQITLKWGVPPVEQQPALGQPYNFQLPPAAQGGGLYIWKRLDPTGFDCHSQQVAPNTPCLIPEGVVPEVWPIVVFAKLNDDPPGSYKTTNPGQLTPQGDATHPIVILQGITVAEDSLFSTVFDPAVPSQPTMPSDHVTALIRPSVVCIKQSEIGIGGTVVTPRAQGPQSDTGKMADLLPPDFTSSPALKGLFSKFALGCLPKGRYGVNLVYSDGQAWTVPNEAASCSVDEGPPPAGSSPTDPTQSVCSVQPRPLLFSQGMRAVLEITDAADPAFCKANPIPADCCPDGWIINGGDCLPPTP